MRTILISRITQESIYWWNNTRIQEEILPFVALTEFKDLYCQQLNQVTLMGV